MAQFVKALAAAFHQHLQAAAHPARIQAFLPTELNVTGTVRSTLYVQRPKAVGVGSKTKAVSQPQLVMSSLILTVWLAVTIQELQVVAALLPHPALQLNPAPV